MDVKNLSDAELCNAWKECHNTSFAKFAGILHRRYDKSPEFNLVFIKDKSKTLRGILEEIEGFHIVIVPTNEVTREDAIAFSQEIRSGHVCGVAYASLDDIQLNLWDNRLVFFINNRKDADFVPCTEFLDFPSIHAFAAFADTITAIDDAQIEQFEKYLQKICAFHKSVDVNEIASNGYVYEPVFYRIQDALLQHSSQEEKLIPIEAFATILTPSQKPADATWKEVILNHAPEDSKSGQFNPDCFISDAKFSSDYSEILKGRQEGSSSLGSMENLVYGPVLFAKQAQSGGRYCYVAKSAPYLYENFVDAFSLNYQLGSSEYLIHKLTDTLNVAYDILSDYDILVNVSYIDWFGKLKVSFTDSIVLQNEIVTSKLSAIYRARISEMESDLSRLGLKHADLVHLLGTAFNKLGSTTRSLHKSLQAKGDNLSEGLKNDILKLIYVSQYIQRFVTNFGDNLEYSDYSMEPKYFAKIVNEYCNLWAKEYYNPYFTIDVELADVHDVNVKLDKDMIFALFDTVLDNALRHGFNKARKPDEHRVLFRLSRSQTPGYVCLEIANNGNSLPEGFSTEQYSSRGNFNGTSGRTGLGGNHVATIVRKHNGTLDIKSSEEWPVIISMKFPIC